MAKKTLISAFGNCPTPQSPPHMKFFADMPIEMYLQTHVVSDILIESAFKQGFSYQETDVIWSLASSHLRDEHLMEVFQKTIAGLDIEFLFKRYPHLYHRPRKGSHRYVAKTIPLKFYANAF